jgi:DUF2934 family protein
MAKRAVRSTVKRVDVVDVVDVVNRGAMSETAVMVQPNGRPSEDEVRVRAYQRYLERGGSHGNDVEDWVEAEKELKGQS